MDREINKWNEGEPIYWSQLCLVRAILDPEKQLRVENDKLISVSLINSSQGEIPRLRQFIGL